jgi:hypothetical protein
MLERGVQGLFGSIGDQNHCCHGDVIQSCPKDGTSVAMELPVVVQDLAQPNSILQTDGSGLVFDLRGVEFVRAKSGSRTMQEYHCRIEL